MESVIKREIENSASLIDLCNEDKRLGYHSEAVGFKFFPEKLRWRISRLRETLEEEFPVVRQRLEEGKSPLGFFDGEQGRVYDLAKEETQNFVFEDGTTDKDTSISVKSTDDSYIVRISANHDDDIVIEPEFTMFVPYVPVRISRDGTLTLCDMQEYFLVGEAKKAEYAKWNCTRNGADIVIELNKKDFGIEDGRVFRMAVKRDGTQKTFWHRGETEFFRLAYNRHRPGSKVFIR